MVALPQVAIIGAGPYGLSIAAHLRARGVEFRIFGAPMHSWRAQMPAGMFLKSEGFASSLYDSAGRYTLRQYCSENGLAYGDCNVPVSRETFIAYGLAFQKKLVSTAEDRAVVALDRLPGGFLLRLDDGERVAARQVVVAVGATYYRYVPENLAHLSNDVLTHSADHHDLSRFKGCDVSVIGGGASALDLAALLDEAGAHVRLIARRPVLRWNTPVEHALWNRFLPASGLGRGLRNRFYEHAPMLFRRLPLKTRLQVVRTWLGPAGAWPVKDRIVRRVPLLLGHTPVHAMALDGRVRLRILRCDGEEHDVLTDHVIAATGYKVNLRKLPFLSDGLRSQLRSVENAPILSADFQSSVPGLYFVGLTAVNTFGPVMRFLLGAGYTSRRIVRQLEKTAVER